MPTRQHSRVRACAAVQSLRHAAGAFQLQCMNYDCSRLKQSIINIESQAVQRRESSRTSFRTLATKPKSTIVFRATSLGLPVQMHRRLSRKLAGGGRDWLPDAVATSQHLSYWLQGNRVTARQVMSRCHCETGFAQACWSHRCMSGDCTQPEVHQATLYTPQV